MCCKACFCFSVSKLYWCMEMCQAVEAAFILHGGRSLEFQGGQAQLLQRLGMGERWQEGRRMENRSWDWDLANMPDSQPCSPAVRSNSWLLLSAGLCATSWWWPLGLLLHYPMVREKSSPCSTVVWQEPQPHAGCCTGMLAFLFQCLEFRFAENIKR